MTANLTAWTGQMRMGVLKSADFKCELCGLDNLIFEALFLIMFQEGQPISSSEDLQSEYPSQSLEAGMHPPEGQ